jgi:hypothetical protein
MPRRKRLKQFFVSEQDYEHYVSDPNNDDLEMMKEVAEYIGESTEEEGLPERIGWEVIGNKDLDEKIFEVNKLREGWIMRKTEKGNIFLSTIEVKKHGKEKYKRGRIQLTVDPEWIGYTAMIVLSKTKTPKFKVYRNEDRVKIEDLKNQDPSDFADIVFEPKETEKAEQAKQEATEERARLSEKEFWDRINNGLSK